MKSFKSNGWLIILCIIMFTITGCKVVVPMPTRTVSVSIRTVSPSISATMLSKETLVPSPSTTLTPTVKPTNTPTILPTDVTLTAIPSSSPTPTSFPPVMQSGWTSYTNANYIRAILIDRNGDLWTGGSGGVVHWDVKKGAYVKYTTEYGLASNYVRAIAQTPDGALWFGTCWGGISRFDGVNWTTYTSRDGLLQDCALSIAVTQDGALWFGSYEGITRYDGESWVSFTPKTTKGLVVRADILAVAPDGNLWVGGHEDGGLLRYDGKEWHDFSQYLPDHTVTAITFALDGTMWVGTKT